jgi:hypothetical protein
MKILNIEQAKRGAEQGFEVTYSMTGLTKSGAEFRAIGGTSARFPTTVTDAEVVHSHMKPGGTVHVTVFVPTEGFRSAGIGRPIKWLREQFDKRVRNF